MFCDIAAINQIDNILFAFVWLGVGIFFFFFFFGVDVCKDRNRRAKKHCLLPFSRQIATDRTVRNWKKPEKVDELFSDDAQNLL